MAVVSRVATLTFLNATGTSSRTWQSTADVQDTAAGGSVVITTVQSTTGLLFPDVANTLTLSIYNDAGALVRAFTLDPALLLQTSTFHFTADGLSTGAARAGTLEIAIRATKTTGGPTATYDYETDGSPATPPQTFTASQVDRGWVRSTTSLVQSISNIALGGGKSEPASFGEGLFVRLTAGAVGYVARTLTVGVNSTTPALSGSTNSTAATVRDVSFPAAVDKRFPAALTVNVGVTVTVPNATLTGLPYTVFTTTTDDIDVDPRVTVEHLMQQDTGSYQTPPLTQNDADDQRLSNQLAYLSTNLRGSRGTRLGTVVTGGVNGLLFHIDLRSQVDTNIFTQGDLTTATRGGETGWADVLYTWSNSLPGGVWRKTITITNAGQQATLTTAYLIGAVKDYTLIAVDPRIGIHAGVTNASNTAGHVETGADIVVVAWIMNTAIGTKESPDVGTMSVAAVRFDPVADGHEELVSDTDNTPTAWGIWASNDILGYYPMTAIASDPKVFKKTFTATDGWGDLNVRFLFRATLASTPYEGFVLVEMTGAANQHDAPDSLNDLSDVSTGGAVNGHALVYSSGSWAPAEVDVPSAAEVANAVWDETTAEGRVAGSYGQLVKDRVDAAVSTRATPADAAAVPAAVRTNLAVELARLDVAVSTRATQAALDTLAAAVTALGAPAQASAWTPARALKVDFLDVAVSTRATPNDTSTTYGGHP